ncbi:HlyD family secretion protein [Mangrovicoccus sp. HB161399]|uniref:HlyD family secretion protein n=1 Tax=Mangrovicoccus sp. HB161399 TaxID=2720392 RepID=UPI001553E4A6|nr:HlyD family secretion protein [Mangrovicoccus sp. HB161399]
MTLIAPKLLVAGTVVLLGAAGTWLNRHESETARQSTADAYLVADYTNVAPEVSSTVVELLVEEDQKVATGDLLAVLDERDLTLAVSAAEAALASAEAAGRVLAAQIGQQAALIRQAAAQLDADAAALDLAGTEEQRARALVSRKSVSQQSLDEAVSALAAAKAAQAGDEAALEAAKGQLAVYEGQKDAAGAAIAQARAALDLARLQLGHARITAPVAGVIGRQTLRVGDYAAAGVAVMSIVPLDRIYVKANFRETQLARVAPGQKVAMTVDAIPHRVFTGHVASLGAASNASYSAIAPANATGNFTKVAQRLPVRIALDPGQEGMERMRVGMSVEPEIDTES